MKPYYEKDGITIYNNDCLEVMKNFEDKSFDLVLTDPPYGIEYYSGRYKGGNPHKKIKGDDKYPVDFVRSLRKKTRKAIFSFCRWDKLTEIDKPSSFIVWVKNNWTAGDLKKEFGRMWEGILFYPLEEFKFNKRIPDVIQSRRVPPTQLNHPTEKPVDIIEHLIRNCSKEGDIILDPFMGSGTTLVAAKKLGRKAVGIEISEEYCEIAKQRLAQDTLDI